jgi:hypothetical protein
LGTELCAEITIAENCSQRALNIIEQARCLRLISGSGENDERSALERAKRLGLSFNSNFANKLAKLLTLADRVQDGVVKGEISLPVGLRLASLPHAAVDALTELFARLPMGLNKQREVLQYLTDIAARENVSIDYLLEEAALKRIIDNPDRDGNLKARQLRTYLKYRRNPNLVRTEQKFQENIAQLRLENNITIAHPPYFEGDTYTLSMRFKSLDQLKELLETFQKALCQPAAAKLFDLD